MLWTLEWARRVVREVFPDPKDRDDVEEYFNNARVRDPRWPLSYTPHTLIYDQKQVARPKTPSSSENQSAQVRDAQQIPPESENASAEIHDAQQIDPESANPSAQVCVADRPACYITRANR